MIQSATMRPMTKRRLYAIPLLLVGLVLSAHAADHTPPPVQPATEFATREAHDDEKVIIAAVPYNTAEMTAIFRVDYLKHGIMPIRLIVTNNSDHAINLRDARILFLTAAGEKIQAAEPEDVERRMTAKERQGSSIPMPGPLPKLHTKPKASNKQIEADFDTFEYSSIVVEPRTTRAGFLFYDVSGMLNPLRGARLLVRKIRDHEGKELFGFEISLLQDGKQKGTGNKE